MDVWWNRQYSLLLPAGALLSKRFLWDISAPPETTYTMLLELLRRVPHCASIAFSLYSFKQGATAPVFVDVPVNIQKGSTSVDAAVLSIGDASKCLEDVAKTLSLSLDELVVSRHKASKARNHVFW